MDKSELDAEILFFFKQFRQYFFHEPTGAPCVLCDECDMMSNNSFFGEKSKEIYEALVSKQGETSVSRE